MSSEDDRRQPKLPGWWTLGRDIATFIGGWALIFLEVQRADIRESVMIFAGTCIGIPGLSVGIASVVEAYKRQHGIDASPSSPHSSVSSP